MCWSSLGAKRATWSGQRQSTLILSTVVLRGYGQVSWRFIQRLRRITIIARVFTGLHRNQPGPLSPTTLEVRQVTQIVFTT